MNYLKACVKESFRLNSTIPCLVRILPEEIILNNYKIPKNTTIFSHFFATCRSNEYFDKPFEYIPERWIGKEKQKIHPFSLLPFGFGTHTFIIYIVVVKLIDFNFLSLFS